MEKVFLGLVVIIILLAAPYFYKLYGLKQITKSDIPSRGDWVELSRGNIYFEWFKPDASMEVKGTMVLVHGFSTPSFVWNGVMEDLLSTGKRVLSYDHFGRGFSDRPKEKYSLKFYVDTLEELLSNLKVANDLHVVGYSMGGPISASFSHQNKEKVKT